MSRDPLFNAFDHARDFFVQRENMRMLPERPTQSNCQQEPPFPGDSTVVFSMRFPNITAHRPTKLCGIEAPHPIAECGEWNA